MTHLDTPKDLPSELKKNNICMNYTRNSRDLTTTSSFGPIDYNTLVSRSDLTVIASGKREIIILHSIRRRAELCL